MMGVVYVLIAFGLTTYWIANTRLIQGAPAIMLFPVCLALGAQFLNRAWLMNRGRFDPIDQVISDQDDAYPRFPGTRYKVLGGLFLFSGAALLVLGLAQILRFVQG